MKDRINLDKVALIGRTFEEYYKIFRLSDFNSNQIKILDVGSGVSSFCAEACEKGMNVIAMDPIYNFDPIELQMKCEMDLEHVINELDGVEHLYIWDIFHDKNDLKEQRERAYKTFLKHYQHHKGERYIAERMPKTSFKNAQFDVIISSHLFFLYDHIFDYRFHKDAIKEMLRIVSKEIRIFPLVSLNGKRSKYFDNFLEYLNFQNVKISIEKVDYEFIRGGNEFLRIKKMK